MRLFWASLSIGIAILFTVSPVFADQATPAEAEGKEFFEAKIRPLLLKRCAECHGAETQEAELRIDAKDDVLGTKRGAPIVVAGDPDKSRLISVVRYNADIQMPPDEKLPAEELQLLEAWVKAGAPWGEVVEHVANATDSQSAYAAREADAIANHWSLQPIARPPIPEVANKEWPANEIDHFVLARLEAEGMTPSPPADKRTLLRRATFDLIGLPPTPEEVAEFLADDSPDAFAKVVDRLLASPHYGERWGRHWLDVARYADTKGYVFAQDRRMPFAYTYRDYVIRAFNEDKPFDQFILEQIAADKLELGEDKTALAALGFLTVGRRFDNSLPDIIDDRIDVVSRGFMGLTVSCARCHDHKYDPIPTADYYSLYGVFASCVEPEELPVIAPADEVAEYDAYNQELAKRQKAYDDYIAGEQAKFEAQLRDQAEGYLFKLAFDDIRAQVPEFAEPDDQPAVRMDQLEAFVIGRWTSYLQQAAERKDNVFSIWREFMALDHATFEEKAIEISSRLASGELSEADQKHNALVRAAFAEHPPRTKLDVARTYGRLLSMVNEQWLDAQRADPATTALADPPREELRQALYSADAAPTLPREKFLEWLSAKKPVDQVAADLRGALEEWKAKAPRAPARAIVLNDAPQPVEPVIFIRGSAGNPGPQVPRQFLKAITRGERRPFTEGSGRLELAKAIADPANPLTARVYVNRVWQHHFGFGLVRTPSDFGVRGEEPTHPELLDYLASSFIDDGWSTKRLHRKIMLSRAYQQSSMSRDDYEQRDPENRLIWRMNRPRLELEPMRDAMLAAAGVLDRTIGGPSVDIWTPPFATRRTVYAYIDRQDLPGIFRVFDFASPDTSMGERPRTTVPQQALFAMNSPFARQMAEKLVERSEVQTAAEPSARVAALYAILFQREPDAHETKLGVDYVAAQTDVEPKQAWTNYAQALLLTNEFMFVD